LDQTELYKKIDQLKIYFTGIDAATSIYKEKIIAASSNDDNYYKNELLYINTIVDNIF
jgi:hypothetical protein